jgi:LysM repeat protein
MQSQIYIVKEGDSLSLISKKLFGDFSKTDEIADMNRLANKNYIVPGQQLLIPNVSDAVAVDAEVLDADGTASKSGWKQSVGKWFPWLFVIAAAGVLGYSAHKQKKKNAAAKTPAKSAAKKK